MGARLHMLGGIDEAGLGPLLGPLVVGGMVLVGPEGKSAWKVLAKGFCKTPRSRKDRRIRVDDSKRVKTGSRGHAELERTALTLLHATHGRLPATVADLLDLGLGDADLTRYPWYADVAAVELPRWQDRMTIELDAHVAARALETTDIRCLGYPFRIVDVGTFNGLIRKHDNKGLMLFDATLTVLRDCLRAADEARQSGDELGLTLVVDRHGARGHYKGLLMRAFPKADIEIVFEGPTVSRYRIGTHTELVFAEHGETRAFPTAAGSCLAKYAREVLIERLNAWFCGRKPGLEPTAGYYTDGRRFLEDLGELRREVPEDLLVRIR